MKMTKEEFGLVSALTLNVVFWTFVAQHTDFPFAAYYLLSAGPGIVLFIIGCTQLWSSIVADMKALLETKESSE